MYYICELNARKRSISATGYPDKAAMSQAFALTSQLLGKSDISGAKNPVSKIFETDGCEIYASEDKTLVFMLAGADTASIGPKGSGSKISASSVTYEPESDPCLNQEYSRPRVSLPDELERYLGPE